MNNKLLNGILKITLILSGAIIIYCATDKVAAQSPKSNLQVNTNSQTQSTSLHLVLPSHLLPISPAEIYSSANLFEVINGEADLYLKAGFVKLTTQRLKLKGYPSKWIEILIYQMSGHRSAFAVFSGQRRLNAKRLKITPFAYQARNALFFVHDSFYVEIIGSDETDSLILTMQQFARAFIDQNPAPAKSIPELALFPKSDLIAGSVAMFSKGAFGFDRFKDVFVARYHSKDHQVTAFISRCSNPSEAVTLSLAYQEFLKEYGGEVVIPSSQIPNAKLIRIHGIFEVVFNYNVYVAGVHQAPTQKAAENLARQLLAHLSAAD